MGAVEWTSACQIDAEQHTMCWEYVLVAVKRGPQWNLSLTASAVCRDLHVRVVSSLQRHLEETPYHPYNITGIKITCTCK